tara:strand:- start:19677 stop:19916 length:240 start_codon:yes stop_codon:yes gene_type:complete
VPNYTLRNIKTKEKIIVNCTYTQLQDKLMADSDLVQMLVMPAIVGGIGNSHANSKTSDGWKDHLNRIKQGSGKNNTIKV